jgi:energy-converting hydrogenase Eha subunit C
MEANSVPTYACIECGHRGSHGDRFCELCGGELRRMKVAFDGGEYSVEEVPSPSGIEDEVSQTPTTVEDPVWKKHVEGTKSGLMLLFIGYFIAWIPFLSFIGSLVLLIGSIKVILGRKAFGERHARNALISAALIAFGVIGILTVYVLFNAAMAQAASESEIVSTMMTFMLASLVILAISELASVLLAYALQKPMGRAVLAGAYGSSIVVFAVFYLAIQNTFQTVLETGAFSSLGFMLQMFTLSLLLAVPSVLYAVAYYMAWNRIKEGEIPEPPGAAPSIAPSS